MAQLFGVVGGIVAVSMIAAWRIRFRSRAERTGPSEPVLEATREPTALSVAPLPPSDFISAVEGALGQEVVLVRLRTPTKVFKLEVPPRSV